MPRLLPLAAAVFCTPLAAQANQLGESRRKRLLAEPSKSLVLRGLRTHERDVAVCGRLARRTTVRRLIWRRPHIEGTSNGIVQAWTSARWNEMSKRRLPTSFCQVSVPTTAVSFDEIDGPLVRQGHGGSRKSGNQR